MKCLDTYALVEINNGNPEFAALLSENIVITDLTFAEFYGDLLRRYDKKTADYWHTKLAAFCRAVSREILLKAIAYRIEHAKENLSFFPKKQLMQTAHTISYEPFRIAGLIVLWENGMVRK